MEIIGSIFIVLALAMVPVGIIGIVSPKTVSPKGKPPLSRLRILSSFVISFFVFGIAGGAMVGKTDAPKPSANSQPIAAANASPASAAPANAPQSSPAEPARLPDHNYAMEDAGLYGYQPGISDAERNQGVATKALVMVRYRGQKNGAYVVEMPDDSGAVLRMECKDPCDYVKTKVIAGGEVLKMETVPNAAGSLMHAVFEDALADQLVPYGKGPK